MAAILFPAWAGAAAQVPTAAVQRSTGGPAIESVYRAVKQRDPFIPIVAASAAVGVCKADAVTDPAAKPPAPKEVNIHLLNLRAMMRSSEEDYALLADPCGTVYIFRNGRLYDKNNIKVDGISGTMKMDQKTLTLQDQQKSVQVYRLGEVDEDKE